MGGTKSAGMICESLTKPDTNYAKSLKIRIILGNLTKPVARVDPHHPQTVAQGRARAAR